MIFNGYWWECEPEEQETERQRQLTWRLELLMMAVETFFPEVDKTAVYYAIIGKRFYV